MDVSYSQIRNMTCPIRHYFTLIKDKSTSSFKPITVGHIVHKLYAKALLVRNFDFYNDTFLTKELHKADKLFLKPTVGPIIEQHIHSSVFKKFPKKLKTEQQYTVVTNRLPHISEEVHIHNKPDVSFFQKDTATVCEIKTGSYQQYDPLQLHYYAWGLSLNSNAQHFISKVLYTVSNSIEVVDVMDKDTLQIRMDRYFDSSSKAYAHLSINNITEVASVMPVLIATESPKLTELFNIIHPEQCVSCNSSIICPAYQKEIIGVFKQRMQNIPISDVLIQCN